MQPGSGAPWPLRENFEFTIVLMGANANQWAAATVTRFAYRNSISVSNRRAPPMRRVDGQRGPVRAMYHFEWFFRNAQVSTSSVRSVSDGLVYRVGTVFRLTGLTNRQSTA